MNNIKHVWFDLAGTLYRETPKFRMAHDQLRYKLYADVMGVNGKRAETEYLELYAKEGSNSAVFRSLGQPSNYWMNAFEQFDITPFIKPDLKIIETLQKMKTIMPISLYTNIPHLKIIETLEYLDLPIDWFSNILSGDDVTERKPALDGFQRIIELSNVDPDEILYVGDRVDVDIKPAHILGITTCLVWSASSEADHSILDFSEITTIL